MDRNGSSGHANEFDNVTALKTADFSGADLKCDLVMKGGVTSGVVYPSSVCRLAKTFRFKNIGGTSAGALAAALAAAAEHARATAFARAGMPQNDPPEAEEVENGGPPRLRDQAKLQNERFQQPEARAPQGIGEEASGLTAQASEGFRRLANVPSLLGSETGLLDLFQPSPKTAKLFDLAITGLKTRSPGAVFVRALGSYRDVTLRAAIVGAAVLAVLVATTVYVAWATTDPVAPRRAAVVAVALATSALLAILSAAAILAAGLTRKVVRAVGYDLPDNEFGMCTGLEKPDANAPLPLTPWLADQIDYIACKTESFPAAANLRPLTFGDLYGTAQENGELPFPSTSSLFDAHNKASARLVNLEMVTTDVTAGRPYRLPFNEEDVCFFYDPADFARFFPQRVLDCMRGTNTPFGIVVGKSRFKVLPFPQPSDLPVVVAARMSMSFPLLFSAVPLYAANRAAVESGDALDTLEFRKTWFSDGGLSSNIPIHFFDGPIPRWPTFALNLRGFPRTSKGRFTNLPGSVVTAEGVDTANVADADKVFVATKYDPDVEIYTGSGPRRLFGFLNSLLDAMRNWNDNTLMQLPGYRERTVEIAMSDTEGGLNLAMPQQTLRSVMTRGYYAGERFALDFGTPSSAAWQQHRQLRIQSALLMQSEWTRRFKLAWTEQLNPTYGKLLGLTNAPWVYTAGQAGAATQFAQDLMDAPGRIPLDVTFTNGPLPAPELRARPRV